MTTTTADARKLYQQVADAVAKAIRGQRYPTGGRLPSERDLAEEFGVSRPTIREAMIALEIWGLVEARHGSGIYVTAGAKKAAETTEPELDIGAFELTEARRLVEGEVCALAASTITDEEIEQLTQIVKAMIAENAADVAGEKADRSFHVTIAQATRNAALVTVVEELWDIRYKSPLCAAMLSRARQAGSRPLIDDHELILNALRTRRPAEARQAMRDHLGRVIEDLLAATEMEALQKARSETAARRTELARRGSI
ncbi:FadR/GntR family transcriptional regulator [Caulobacter sp. NIBR2454]|uniref:FadR/GntR family transcriptional regulator n=1 Tax=Caulobacter sp. NIBR2454 TaxID=3015996 RepID=UPI0022B5F4D0|nr:FadR/GntR family transcriptional regulator [Caulobacter sp. NIBR2454]